MNTLKVSAETASSLEPDLVPTLLPVLRRKTQADLIFRRDFFFNPEKLNTAGAGCGVFSVGESDFLGPGRLP